MFRSMPDPEPAHDVISDRSPEPLVPLSHLELDLPRPAAGWPDYLGRRAIAFVPDDLGRECVRRQDAPPLLDEKREAENRAAKLRQLQEQLAVEADELRRSQIWKGVSADAMPPGAAPASVMLALDKDSQPRRTTPLEEALSNSAALTYHPMQGEEAS